MPGAVGKGTTFVPRSIAEADNIVFRYPGRSEPLLCGCNLEIHAGDRLLVEGTSGGGKSTLALLLAGIRQPDSGLLLVGGMDLATLGVDGWRRRVATAPQFHENHVLTETLAFNLLMGKRWPPASEDLQEAKSLCGELGLRDLIARMPGGLLQMVGETGWRLSHGERSRLFIARALLQGVSIFQATVKRSWTVARAWLRREISRPAHHGSTGSIPSSGFLPLLLKAQTTPPAVCTSLRFRLHHAPMTSPKCYPAERVQQPVG